jgi:hypothetical protein
MDNVNTPVIGSLYEQFRPEEARRNRNKRTDKLWSFTKNTNDGADGQRSKAVESPSQQKRKQNQLMVYHRRCTNKTSSPLSTVSLVH